MGVGHGVMGAGTASDAGQGIPAYAGMTWWVWDMA